MTPLEYMLLNLMILFALILFVLVFLIWLSKNTAKILYFDSENTCKLENKRITDEKIEYETKIFHLNKVKPYSFKGRLGWQPFLIFKYGTTHPITLSGKPSRISPMMAKNMYKRKTLETLTRPHPTNRKELMFMILVGGLGGFGIGFIIAMGMGGM